mgnify:CR=1 FL=1
MSGVREYGLGDAGCETRVEEYEQKIEEYAVGIREYAPLIEENGLGGEDDGAEIRECAVEV